jgi:hypothetical protein
MLRAAKTANASEVRRPYNMPRGMRFQHTQHVILRASLKRIPLSLRASASTGGK